MRIAILGLYRSGSSVTAEILYNLGVNMGAPFFREYYESSRLADKLRIWWREPLLEESVAKEERIKYLKTWLIEEESKGIKWIGAKHPLLAACPSDLIDAWGEVKFIWAYRDLDRSISSSLLKFNWQKEVAERIQRELWKSISGFLGERDYLKIVFSDYWKNPSGQVNKLIDYLGLAPSSEQMERAYGCIKPISET